MTDASAARPMLSNKQNQVFKSNTMTLPPSSKESLAVPLRKRSPNRMTSLSPRILLELPKDPRLSHLPHSSRSLSETAVVLLGHLQNQFDSPTPLTSNPFPTLPKMPTEQRYFHTAMIQRQPCRIKVIWITNKFMHTIPKSWPSKMNSSTG